MNMTTIAIKDLSLKFDDNVVFDKFSCDFNSQFNVIKGASGIGKTTLLRVILSLQKTSHGQVSFSKKSPKFSVVFQEDRLIEELSAIDNISICCPEKAKKEIADALASIGIQSDLLSNPISTFSGGMKRRVAIIRALLSNSDIVIMDEPLTGLDVDTTANVISVIKQLINDRTILIASHTDYFDSFSQVVEL